MRSFGAAVSRSGPPAGRFLAKLSENPIFRCNSLIGGPNVETSVPTVYYTPMGSARVGFGVLAQPFPALEPRRAVFEPNCPKIPFFGVIL